jgi:hypothetical protein
MAGTCKVTLERIDEDHWLVSRPHPNLQSLERVPMLCSKQTSNKDAPVVAREESDETGICHRLARFVGDVKTVLVVY